MKLLKNSDYFLLILASSVITSVKARSLIIGKCFKILFPFVTKMFGMLQPLLLFHLVSQSGITTLLTLLIVLWLSVHHRVERKVCCKCMVRKRTNQGEKEVMETKGQKIN